MINIFNQQIQKIMHYQQGNMRELNYDHSPSRQSWACENDFQYTQRSKYQKSQVSYAHQQKSKVHYDYDGDRTIKAPNTDSKDIQKSIPFKLKSPDHEDRFGFLHVQMYISTEKNLSTFTIHFTDEKDSLFLWSCFVRESEFPQIKSKLSLKVDFHAFPEMLNQLFECCVDLQKNPKIGNKDSFLFAVFQIKKDREQADFRIMEANKFKQSEHFHLLFKKSNDQQLKRYLSHKFDAEKSQNYRLNRQISQLTDKLNRRIQEVQTLSINLQNIQKQKNEKIQDLERSQRDKIKRQIMRLEEEKIRQQKQQQQKNERKYEEMSQKIKQLSDKNFSLNQQLASNHKQIVELVESEKSLKSRCSLLDKQVASLETFNEDYKNKDLKMGQMYHTLKNQNTKLSCTIESLEQRLKEKQERLAETNSQKSSNSNQISTLQENLRQQKRKIQKLQEKNENLQAELNKIKRKYDQLEKKHEKKKSKISEYINIIKSQQQKVQDKDKDIKRILMQLSQQKMESNKKQIQISEKQQKIKDYKLKLDQYEGEIDHLKKVLANCHKDINSKRFETSSRIPSYSPLASGVGREFSSTTTITPTETSRIKYSPIASEVGNHSPMGRQKIERNAPLPIKKYREGGIQNDRNRENSKSPIVSKLSQQLDPEDTDKTRQKIGPIKFRK